MLRRSYSREIENLPPNSPIDFRLPMVRSKILEEIASMDEHNLMNSKIHRSKALRARAAWGVAYVIRRSMEPVQSCYFESRNPWRKKVEGNSSEVEGENGIEYFNEVIDEHNKDNILDEIIRSPRVMGYLLRYNHKRIEAIIEHLDGITSIYTPKEWPVPEHNLGVSRQTLGLAAIRYSITRNGGFVS